jgi:putative heme-binding domain-containing protein
VEKTLIGAVLAVILFDWVPVRAHGAPVGSSAIVPPGPAKATMSTWKNITPPDPPFAREGKASDFLSAATLYPARAQQSESLMVKLLKSGRVPEARQPAVIEMIGKRGNEADLTYLYEQIVLGSNYPAATRRKALEALVEAAENRKVGPAHDHEKLIPLVEAAASPASSREHQRKSDADAGFDKPAIRLAGLWKLAGATEPLRKIAQSPALDEPVRSLAFEALAALGGQIGRAQIESLAGGDQPAGTRILAIAALAHLDVNAAAGRVAEVLPPAAAQGCDLAPLLAAFLNRQGGPEILAAALDKRKLPPDAAKLALRSVYALGHGESALVAALSRAAGLSADVKPLSPKELSDLVTEVASKGDPARGEALFRRAELNCLSCHSISKAGGDVGPDLSAIGQSSPADYIINSILTPDQSIKEQFHTLVVLTNDGHVYQGIVADKDNQRVVLREANGALRTVPVDTIDDQKPGGSLMPKGLVNLMTRAEFVDLVRFLSELGKPGPYAIRSTPTIQRWQVLKSVPNALARSTPSKKQFQEQILGAAPASWISAFSKVSGALPLNESPIVSSSALGNVIYIKGELDVSTGGPIQIELDSAAGANVWIDDQPVRDGSTRIPATLAPGRHSVTLRIDRTERPSTQIKVEITKPAGSPTEFTVVGGR